jgi:hypothetical protein
MNDDDWWEEPNIKFYADQNGDLYLKGKIYAESGVFKGDVFARDLKLGEGNVSVLDSLGKIKGTSINGKGLRITSNDNGSGTNFLSAGSAPSPALQLGSTEIVRIGHGDYAIKVLSNGRVTIGSSVVLSWDSLSDVPDDLASKDDIPSTEQITTITKNTISTATITATQINWGDGKKGLLNWTTGNDGEGSTDLAQVYSTDGILINARNGGVRIYGSKGIWLDSKNVNFRTADGSYHSLAEFWTLVSGLI